MEGMSSTDYPTTARVNGSMLPHFIDKTVRLIGKLEHVQGTQLTLATGQGPSVRVMASEEVETKGYVEVLGKVNDDLSIAGYIVTPIGDTFGTYTQS